MNAAALILASAAGTLISMVVAALFGWEYLLLAPVVGSLLMAVVAYLIAQRTEQNIQRSIWAEDLNDRHERLRDLLDECPVRKRFVVIDGDNITMERRR